MPSESGRFDRNRQCEARLSAIRRTASLFGTSNGSPAICGHKKTTEPKFCRRDTPRSGKRGIRTPGTLQFNGFQDRRDRPLRHLSETNRDKCNTDFPFRQILNGFSHDGISLRTPNFGISSQNSRFPPGKHYLCRIFITNNLPCRISPSARRSCPLPPYANSSPWPRPPKRAVRKSTTSTSVSPICRHRRRDSTR